jgi:hypothetical protein
MEVGVAISIRPSEDERVVLGLPRIRGAGWRQITAAPGSRARDRCRPGQRFYLNRCMQKGLVKVSQAPARRYAYYLTPQGFVEKFRLSLEYLAYSFRFFRQAKLDCESVFELARARGFARIALDGASDIVEIATICAREAGIEIVAIVDEQSTLDRYAGIPIASNYDSVVDQVDAVIITDVRATQARAVWTRQRLGHDRVLIPSLLQKASGLSEDPDDN